MKNPSPLLRIENLSVHFQTEETQPLIAVNNISFSIDAGQIVALVGESGSGKSVTAHAILKLLPHPQASLPNGAIFFEGKNLLELSEPKLRKIRGNEISMIFQEPMLALNPLHTIEKQLAEILWLHKQLRGDAARQRILHLLDRVGIPEPEKRLQAYPHELSGGQRQRVMIAMALANEPKLLIADEPTTALDVTIQAQILDLLLSLQKDFNMAILLITHDLHSVRKIADKIVVMQTGKIVEQGLAEKVLHRPEHPYTQALIAAEPSGTAIPIAPDAPHLLVCKDITVWFPLKKGLLKKTYGYIHAVNHINLHLRQGETLGIVGESGSGKSTLALALLRLIKSQGIIHFNQQNLSDLTQKQLRPLRKNIQIVFQDPFGSLSPRMCVRDIIAEGLRVHERHLSAEIIDDRVVQSLTEVGLDPESRFRYPHEFSGGQRQRIAIARALILKPQLIILDEPTSALDRSVQKQVLDLLKSLQLKYSFSTLFISHDLSVIRAISHRIMVMKDGNLVEQGDTQTIFANPQQEYTRQLIQAAFLK